ncbi:MAG: hypothetical protein ACYTAF_15965 [Planctomycetota bacterium]
MTLARSWWRPFRFPLFSPAGFLTLAVFLLLLYVVASLAGLRDHATALTGTPASAEGSVHMSMGLGALYVLLYFCFLLAAPVLAIAAGLLFVVDRALLRRSAKAEPETPGVPPLYPST